MRTISHASRAKKNPSSPSCFWQDGDDGLNESQKIEPLVAVLSFEILNARLLFHYEMQLVTRASTLKVDRALLASFDIEHSKEIVKNHFGFRGLMISLSVGSFERNAVNQLKANLDLFLNPAIGIM